MLCQNCQKKDATTHLKRINNGEMSEIHLCADCAAALGCGDIFSGFSAPFGGMLGAFFGEPTLAAIGNKVLRCDTCSFTYDDIVRTGKPGCPDCYRVFYDKLLPSLQKIHGRSVYCGKIPKGATEETRREFKLNALKKKLNDAIDEQNFEAAATIRDEIKAVLSGGEI